eukprot:4755116-Prymnesium_polylepis.1
MLNHIQNERMGKLLRGLRESDRVHPALEGVPARPARARYGGERRAGIVRPAQGVDDQCGRR